MKKFYRKNIKKCLLVYLGLLTVASYAQDNTVTIIEADGPGETYTLLESKLGGSPLEVPDCDHEEPFRHIEEIYDDILEKYVFKFHIHKDTDTDRCKTNTDRQRNEIKAYDPSPDALKAIRREVVTYEWYFKIDAQFQPSGSFTHLFQLKAVGGTDAANPLLTITPRKGDPDKLQLIHGRGSNAYTTVQEADLSMIKGQWVKAFCEVVYAEDTGKLDLQLQLLDGTEVMSFVDEAIDMWRTGSSFVRPKWGIYRSLNDMEALRDEEVLFADFKVSEIGACPVWYEDADGDGLGDPNSVEYACERPEGYVQNNVDTCHDWYKDADGDGLGNPDISMYWCDQPEGYVDNSDDPDDSRNDVLATEWGTDRVEIYPNPVESTLYLSGVAEYITVHLFDIGGRWVLSHTGNLIDVRHLKRGTYLLKTETGEIFRLVKK